MRQIKVIDSHTGGEPTRVVMEGGPDLGQGPLAEQRERLRREHDRHRAAIVTEPRASNVMVGAWPTKPHDTSCIAGVIFFNNVGYLDMCGHGMIGFITTMARSGRVKPGVHRVETPAGIITATLHGNGEVSIANVASWRARKAVSLNMPNVGPVTGDVAYGGNWFFLTESPGLALALNNVDRLADFCRDVRRAANAQGFPEIDHVELFGKPASSDAHSRNFVLCPGGAYDRSPCGTGTSAKMACLAAEGTLDEDVTWIQEGITGSQLKGSFRWVDRASGRIEPTVTGRAFVTAETTLLLDEDDPFCWGLAGR